LLLKKGRFSHVRPVHYQAIPATGLPDRWGPRAVASTANPSASLDLLGKPTQDTGQGHNRLHRRGKA